MTDTDRSCRDFITALAGKDPTPGGGGASALVGAIGVALGNMVGSLTLGKAKYREVEADILALKAQADSLQEDLLTLAEEDARVFLPLSRAYSLPRETEEQRLYKAAVMESALLEACGVPLAIMEKCCDAIMLQQQFAEKGCAIAISDVGVGVAICQAALKGAALNVYINTNSLADRQQAAALEQKAQQMLEHYLPLADQIYEDVLGRFK